MVAIVFALFMLAVFIVVRLWYEAPDILLNLIIAIFGIWYLSNHLAF